MVINFGSINIDHVYSVIALPKAGETVLSKSYEKFLGGKGVNQSIAIAQAGSEVIHVGAVGSDGNWALSEIEKLGVKTSSILKLECATGHAIITVGDDAENQIILAGGANQEFTEIQINEALENGNSQTDWVCLQNETNLSLYITEKAKAAGYKIAYSAAPFIAETTIRILPHVDLLAVNEGEATELAKTLGLSLKDIPVPQLLTTKGTEGAEFKSGNSTTTQSAFSVEAVDTTGAGDTFFGCFLAEYSKKPDIQSALRFAAAASALQVTKPGAATAIPARAEVMKFLQERTGA